MKNQNESIEKVNPFSQQVVGKKDCERVEQSKSQAGQLFDLELQQKRVERNFRMAHQVHSGGFITQRRKFFAAQRGANPHEAEIVLPRGG